MEAVTRPAASCCRRAVSSAPATTRLLLNPLPAGARQKSTSARTRRALNIPPHPSFLNPTTTAADGTTTVTRPTTDEIIFNPPSSAPSVFHTPFKFLPPTDPRRRANLASALISSSTTQPSSSTSAPTPESFPSIEGEPLLKPRHHLTKSDIEEMRRLRAADPVANSVGNLAQRFQCTKLFVLMCCAEATPKEHKERVQEDLDKVKGRWGPKRRAAREERGRRNAMLFGGEL